MVAAVSHNVLTLSWACGLLKESQGPLHLKQALPAFTAALPDEQQAGGASGQGGEALGLRWQEQRAGQASPAIPVPQASPGSSNSTQSVADMETDAGGVVTSSWPRKPLVQWAAQLECYGGGRYQPQHHVGVQPPKPCLRRCALVELSPAEEAQLRELSAAVPKSAVNAHPKAQGSLLGKRSRMSAFR